MPPIISKSKDGQDHKDKCFDTSKKILSQELNDHLQYGSSNIHFLEVMTNVNFS